MLTNAIRATSPSHQAGAGATATVAASLPPHLPRDLVSRNAINATFRLRQAGAGATATVTAWLSPHLFQDNCDCITTLVTTPGPGDNKCEKCNLSVSQADADATAAVAAFKPRLVIADLVEWRRD